MDIFSYFIISISFLSGSPQSSFSGIRARSVSQRVQIGKGIFLPFTRIFNEVRQGGKFSVETRAERC